MDSPSNPLHSSALRHAEQDATSIKKEEIIHKMTLLSGSNEPHGLKFNRNTKQDLESVKEEIMINNGSNDPGTLKFKFNTEQDLESVLVNEKTTINKEPLQVGSNEPRTCSFWKYFILMEVILVMLIGIDLYLITQGKFSFHLGSGNLSLLSTRDYDMSLVLNNKVGFSSYFQTIEARSSHCVVYYDEFWNSSDWLDVITIDGVATETGMSFHAHDTEFSAVRHLLNDRTWRKPSAGGGSIQCHIDLDVYLLHSVVVTSTVHASVTVASLSDSNVTLSYAGSTEFGAGVAYETSFNTLNITAASSSSDDNIYTFMDNIQYWFDRFDPILKSLPLNYTMINPFHEPMKELFSSFIVTMPGSTISATVFGDMESGGRFVLASTAFEVDLILPTLQLKTNLSLACSESFKEAVPVQDCALPGPTKLWSYYQAMSSRRINLVADAGTNNFISNLAGSHHFITGEITNSSHASTIRRRHLDTTSQSQGFQHKLEALDLSSQGACMSLNVDDTFQLIGCEERNAGLAALRMHLLDREGVLAMATLRNSWVTKDTADMSTELRIQSSDANSLFCNVTFSERQQLAKLNFVVRERDINLLRASMNLHWAMNEGDSSPHWAHFQAHLAGAGTDRGIQITSKLELENKFYNASLELKKTESRTAQVPPAFSSSAADISRAVLDNIQAFAIIGEGYCDPANYSTVTAQILARDGQEVAVVDSRVQWAGWENMAVEDSSWERLEIHASLMSKSIGSSTFWAVLDHTSVSLEVSLSGSRGVEQLLMTNALSWENPDSSSGYVSVTSYFDPYRVRLNEPRTMLNNSSAVPIQMPSPVPIQIPSTVPIQIPSPVPIQMPSSVPHSQQMLYCDKYTTYLYLSNRGLTELPDISHCTSLEYLYLSNNQLTELPDLSTLTSLQGLYLSNNQLTELPDLSTLTSLKYLDVSNNLLAELPDLSTLTSLQGLYLSNNHLTELPPSIGRLRSLYNLDVSYNMLVGLPMEITQLSSYCWVDVMHNRITNIADEIFDRFRTYLSYGCNPGYMFYYCYDSPGGKKDFSLYEVLSSGWNMTVSMQYDQEGFGAQLSEYAIQEDRKRYSMVLGGNYSAEDRITVHSLGRWDSADVDWDAVATLHYTDSQYLTSICPATAGWMGEPG